ncbi:hypothetical protein AB0E55_10170 [Amycolatopsis keratiniphila]
MRRANRVGLIAASGPTPSAAVANAFFLFVDVVAVSRAYRQVAVR